MEPEDVAEERARAEDPDPLDLDACIVLQGLSKAYPAEVRTSAAARGMLSRKSTVPAIRTVQYCWTRYAVMLKYKHPSDKRFESCTRRAQ